jgi:hypothetical protein
MEEQMPCDAVNFKYILIAGAGAWILGFIYYTVLSKPWKAAMTAAELAACENRDNVWMPFALCLVANIFMAYMLDALLHYVAPGVINARAGIISAFFIWLGFIVTPMIVNAAFSMRKPMLTAIDSGYWLLALVLQGALLGGLASGEIKLPF